MPTELEQILDEIIVQKDTYLIPENIRSGVSVLGVEGTYEGTDTSDATASADDILSGETAYVNGEKLTGTIEYRDGVSGSDTVDLENGIVETTGQDGTLELRHTFNNRTAFKEDYKYGISASSSDVANVIGLTTADLRKDVTVLGVTGTLEEGPLTNEEYEQDLVLTYKILGDYITQDIADDVGPVLNQVLGVTDSSEEGGRISEAEALLDVIAGNTPPNNS